ncbi:MAG: DUF4198 domain-containing protein, partial [Acidobacteria bacterium]|nr:DUF4198 domain-containing protein [Acidobacteriota bacterium]
MKKAAVGLALALAATSAPAHDLWLVAYRYQVEPGGSVRILASTGMNFPASTNALDPLRIERFVMSGPAGSAERSDWIREGTLLAASIQFDLPGIHLVGLELKPHPIELTADEFREYLEHEGLAEAAALRRERGEEDRPGREVYSKHVKTLFLVGAGPETGFDRPIGLRIEIIPLQNPFLVRPGGELPVRVLFQGDPLAGVPVVLGREGLGEGNFLFRGKTDARGEVSVPV